MALEAHGHHSRCGHVIPLTVVWAGLGTDQPPMVPVRWGRFPLDLPRLPMSMLMVIVAADIFGIAEWATGDHAEQSRLFYRSAFGIGTVGVAIKALLAGSGL